LGIGGKNWLKRYQFAGVYVKNIKIKDRLEISFIMKIGKMPGVRFVGSISSGMEYTVLAANTNLGEDQKGFLKRSRSN